MLVVLGEVVVDLLEQSDGDLRPVPGGSPANVALALARLGDHVELMARFGGDALGDRCERHVRDNGVGLAYAVRADQPSTLALVTLDELGHARYGFWTEGTSDWQWTAAELAATPTDAAALHTGSLASWLPPSAAPVLDLLHRTRAADATTVSYDPNVRAALMGTPDQGRAAVEGAVAAAHVVKASDEDVAWLYPGTGLTEVAARWLGLGADLVVVTRGADGPLGITADAVVDRAAPGVRVSDTVGAGDTFTAGLLHGLAARDALGAGPSARLRALSADALGDVLHTAAAAAALTCTRPGCDPPTAAELDAFLAAEPTP